MNKIAGKIVGNTTATPMSVPDWLQEDSTKADYIKNKPENIETANNKLALWDEKKVSSDNYPSTMAVSEKIKSSLEDFEVANNPSTKNMVNTLRGVIVSTNDSAEAPLKSMKIFGKTEQFTTTGKNKLPYPYAFSVNGSSITQNGVTYVDNGDGSISVSGTATAYSAVNFNDVALLADTAYKFHVPNYAGSNLALTATLYDETNTQITSFSTPTDKLLIEINTTLYPGVSFARIGVKRSSDNATTSGKIYPQLQLSSVTDDTWEPYTGGIPSPNPNYPQELVSVGDSGSTTEYVMGGNLFDISADTRFTKQEDGSYISNSPITATKFPLVLPFGTYTYSYDLSCKTGINGRLSIGLKDGSRIELYATSDGSFKHTKNTFTGEVVNWCFVCSNVAGAGEMIIKNLQLGVGSTEKPYEPYKEQSLTIPTPNGLGGLNDTCDYIDLKRGVRVQRIGEYVFTGVEDANNCWYDGNEYVWVDDKGYFSAVKGRTDNVICTHFLNVRLDSLDENNVQFAVQLNSDDGWTVESFKQFLKAQYDAGTPVKIIYILAEPIETPLTEEEIQAYKALHTNYPNTTIYNSDGAGAEVEYLADMKNYIDNKFAELQANILSVAK